MYLDEHAYEEFHRADDKFFNQILQQRLRSDFQDSVLDLEEKYQMGPTSGYLTKKYDDNTLYNAIDCVKAYTHCLGLIDMVPVFGHFDIYKIYDNHPIESWTMYCVEVHTTDIKTSILFPEVYSRCFGFQIVFAQKQNIQVKIQAYRRPSRLERVNYKRSIERLYKNDKIELSHKKHIVNKTTGLTEKRYNTAHVCKVFSKFAEAQFYQLKLKKNNGKIFTLQQGEKREKEKVLSDQEWMDKYYEGMSSEEYYEKYPEKKGQDTDTDVGKRNNFEEWKENAHFSY